MNGDSSPGGTTLLAAAPEVAPPVDDRKGIACACTSAPCSMLGTRVPPVVGVVLSAAGGIAGVGARAGGGSGNFTLVAVADATSALFSMGASFLLK